MVIMNEGIGDGCGGRGGLEGVSREKQGCSVTQDFHSNLDEGNQVTLSDGPDPWKRDKICLASLRMFFLC